MGPGVRSTPEEIREAGALLVLKGQSGLGDRGIKRLVESSGSGVRALRAAGDQTDLLAPAPQGHPLDAWMEAGIGILPMTSSRYPSSLRELTDPPPVLFWIGDPDLLEKPSVAIVGSRKATPGGRRTAETMGRVLAGAGVTVVSGMALGIDGAAHRGALEGGGRTVAVLGSGFHMVYPAAHRGLFREICSLGLAISEFLPDEPALPHHFPKRNRIIAALAEAVIVVEAGARSGALITVDHALDLGKDVFAVPGSVESSRSAGSNVLLRDGARPLVEPTNLLEELRASGVDLIDDSGVVPPEGKGGRTVPAGLQSVWDVLASEPLTVEEVAIRAGIPVGETLAGLSALELGGWASQCPGSRFQRR